MENIDEIIEKLHERDLKILVKAKNETQLRVNEDLSKANLDAFHTASKMLAEYMAGEKEPDFENRLEAHKYLQRLGYKIGRSKFYQDCKAGLIRMQAGGSVLESDVKAYIAKAGLVKPDQIAYEVESSDLQRKKQEREVEKLTAQVEEMTIKIDVMKKNLLNRDRVETEQAIKAGTLVAGIQHTFRNFARDSIQLVEGNLKHTRTLIKFWVTKTEDLFDEFARMEEIIVELDN